MTVVALPRKVATTATASATLLKGRHTPLNAAGGSLSMALPTDASEGVVISVERIDSSGNTVAVTGNIRATASQSISITGQYEALTLLSDAGGSWWPIGPNGAYYTKSQVDALIASASDTF